MRTFVILSFLIVIATNLFAQNNTAVTVGGSLWNSQINWVDDEGDKLGDLNVGSMYGPYLSVSRGKLSLGASFVTGSYNPIKSKSYSVGSSEADTRRSDLNASLGYQVHQNVNLFFGVKYTNWKLDWLRLFETGSQFGSNFQESGMMYGAGISLLHPFGSSGFLLFGSMAGMAGKLSLVHLGMWAAPGAREYKINCYLAALNLGVGYQFASGLGINLGYRADLFAEESKEKSGYPSDDPRIRVHGAVLALFYSL